MFVFVRWGRERVVPNGSLLRFHAHIWGPFLIGHQVKEGAAG